MSARDLIRGAVIELELDPALIPQSSTPHVDVWIRMVYFARDWRLRLSPCKGGVRFLRLAYAHVIHATPASLAADLEHLGNYAATTAEIYPPSATRTYWEDRAAFWRLAARAVCEDVRILRMWGLA